MASFEGFLPDSGPVIGVVRHDLRDDVHGPLQGFFGAVHPKLRLDVGGGDSLRRTGMLALFHDQLRQRLKAFLPGLDGPGFPLLLVGAVKVFDPLKHVGFQYLRFQLIRQLALLVDEPDDLVLALIQVSQVGQPFVKLPQHLVVQSAGGLFSVPGDKGDGAALVQQLDGIRRLLFANPEFGSELLDDHVHRLT